MAEPVALRSASPDPDAPAVVVREMPVVVVGAGTPEALAEFVAAFPAGAPVALVACVSGADGDAVAGYLRGRSALDVCLAGGARLVEPATVTVVPDGSEATFERDAQRALRLVSGAGHGLAHTQSPLEMLLRSLASVVGPRAAAVVLDGPVDGGAVGLFYVKERAGLTMAQSGTRPGSAAHAAVATGDVDVADTPVRLAERLLELLGDAATFDPLADAGIPATPDDAFGRILSLIRVRSGHDFALYKPTTLLRRIGRRMQVVGASSMEAYAGLLEHRPDEGDVLLRDLLISVTEFFRDPEAFAALARDVVPALFEGREPGRPLRVWVAGCASGEEAYSIAMLLLEHAETLAEPAPVQVFATDIDALALARARAGVYPATVCAAVSPARLARFFEPVAEGCYRVRPALRERVLFASHSLIADPPFSRLDLVSCRNVLIYLARDVQARVFEAFHYALRPGGFLFLGSSEGPESATRTFREVDSRARVFERRGDGRVLPRLSSESFRAPAGRALPPVPGPSEGVLSRYAAHALAQHTPPRLLVDERGEVVHVFGRAGDYLRDHDGPATQSAVAKIADRFRLDLRTALFRAFHHAEAVGTRFRRVDVGGEARVVRLRVAPVEAAVGERLAEVVFVELDAKSADALGGIEASDAANPAAGRLEDELARTSERLSGLIDAQEATNEDLRVANEELQSVNEELRSATEELETSQEELQSINEELATVNEDLRQTNEDLVRSNADLQNLIASTEIGTVFLDERLTVQRFTPRASDTFYLIPSDVGRPLGHVAHRLVATDLAALAAGVLQTATPVEQAAETTAGRWVLLRLSPYRAADGRPSGVVLTTVDVTELKAAQRSAEDGRRRQQAVASLGETALRADPGTLLRHAAELVADVLGGELVGIFRLEPDGQTFCLAAGTGWDEGVVGEALLPSESAGLAGYALGQADPTGTADRRDRTRPRLFARHGVRAGLSVALESPGGSALGIVGTYSRTPREFTEPEEQFLRSVGVVLGAALQRAADAATIRRQLDDLKEVYAHAPVGLGFLDAEFRYVRTNDRLAAMKGMTRDALVGRTVAEAYPPAADHLVPLLERVLTTGEPVRGAELRYVRADGDERVWRVLVAPQVDDDAAVVGLHLVKEDVTEIVRTREALAEARQSLDRVLEAGQLGMWALDLDAGMVHYDERGQQIVGLKAVTRLEDAFAGLHPEDAPRVSAAMAAFFDAPPGDVFESEHRHVHPDGTARWVAVWAHGRFREGRCVGVDGVALDITERRRSEQTVRVQFGEIESYFEAVPVGVAVLDREHRYVRVNSRMSDLFRQPAERFPGRRAAEMNPAYDALHHAYVERVFAHGLPVVNVEVSAAASDKPEHVRHWLASYFPVQGEAGAERVSLVVQDVTPLKLAQGGLERLARELEARVEERTAQVRRLAADLTQAEQAERRRVAQVLHDDLQQILYAAQMRLHLAAQAQTLDAVPELTAAADGLLAQAIETARTLAVDLSPPILAGEGLERSFEWLALRMDDTYGLRVRVEAEGETPVAPDVHALLFSLVRELLFNVVKHAGVDTATVRLRRDGGTMEIVVEDDGGGFAMTTLSREGDAGFGLVSVYERLGHIGGDMQVASAPGEGTRVVIRAPLWDATARPDSALNAGTGES